ncbi:MAG TPA: tripartite tricarboxylate transporter substrate binding protein [Xanthobacteraceae bacterium]|jgi:tripartite-type tricarboxylate transporter receptor subunit TctC|nr:tripartite tricarboxylate transporter substrate binding protein [Xanthobacteraceae bacterium]
MHIIRLIAIVALAAVSTSVSAQWRGDPMKIIVPFAAGGAVDQIARIIASNMPPEISAIVDNRGGAGGDLGVIAAESAAPDGRTVLLHTSSMVINPIVRGKADDASRQFEPLARVGDVKFVLVVPDKFPAATFPEFLAAAKKGKALSYGSTGPGTTLQIAAEMLKDATGIAAVHVPYRGLNPAFTDLLAGNIDFMVTSVTGILPYVKSGLLRPLATFNAERANELPQVPTTIELGYPSLKISNWYGLFVSSGVPASKRKELEDIFIQVLRTPHVRSQLEALGVSGIQSSSEFKDSIAQESSYLQKLVKRLGIVAE